VSNSKNLFDQAKRRAIAKLQVINGWDLEKWYKEMDKLNKNNGNNRSKIKSNRIKNLQ